MTKDALMKCKIAIASTVVAAAILIGLNAWVGHFAQAGQNTRSIEETQEIQGQLAENQEHLVELVDELAALHKVEDAELSAWTKLCNAGKLTDCDDCAEAGVTLPKCVE